MTLAQQVRDGKAHVGVKIDGHRVDIGASSMMDLVCLAYKVQRYQVTGPDWMTSQRFDVMATLPEGASQDQVPEMMQALLADRFKLTLHHENKDHPTYALVVGKNGVKMKEAPPDADKPAPAGDDAKNGDTGAPRPNIRTDGRGGTTISGGPNGTTRITTGDGVIHIESSKMIMAQLVVQLTQFMDHPVFDMTNLKGNWQVAMDIPISALLSLARARGLPMPAMPLGANSAGQPGDAASDPSGLNEVFESVQKLGLRLDSRRAQFEDIVVNHLEKTPTEN